jgi:YVTN family beta-propeller protein
MISRLKWWLAAVVVLILAVLAGGPRASAQTDYWQATIALINDIQSEITALGKGSWVIQVTNAGTTGTTLNTLTSLSGTPSTAIIATTAGTGIVGITVANAGTTGTATIQIAGTANCIFDGATTANHGVTFSTTTGGDCHDTGTAALSGQSVVTSTNATAGTYAVNLFPFPTGAAAGSSGAIQYNNAGAFGGAVLTGLVLGNGSSAPTAFGGNSLAAHNFAIGINASGVLSGAQPGFGDLSGNIAISQIASGTGASSSTFLRGDNTWATPAAGGVTSVTGTSPIVSSGGTTPAISLSGVTAEQGNGSKVQLSTGTTTSGDCVKYDANGNAIDAGAACGSGGGTPGGTSGELQYNNAGAFGGVPAVNGDGTLNTSTGALAVTKTGGAPFGPLATQATPCTVAQGCTNSTTATGALVNLGGRPGDLMPYAYVANFGTSTVSVISTATNTVAATVTVGPNPLEVAVTPNGLYAYATNYTSGTVSVISTATNTVVATITVGTNPQDVAVTPNGLYAYVANNGTGTVSVISTATNTVVATITVGTNPLGVAVTPNGLYAYVANNGTSTVSVISTATNTVAATVTVGTAPSGVMVTPNGLYAYVANNGTGTVSVISTATNTVAATVTVGPNPYGVRTAVSPQFIAPPNEAFGTVSAGSITISPPNVTLTGTAGTASCSQSMQGTLKVATCYFNGYQETGTAQTYTYPTAFSAAPVLLESGGSCGTYNPAPFPANSCTASGAPVACCTGAGTGPTCPATTLLLPANASMTAETCNVVAEGQ